MDRAFASGASASAPTAPTTPSVGFATGGNPATGTPATRPGPYWFHMVSEEIRAAIVQSGQTPSQAELDQLAKALSVRSTVGTTRYRSAAVATCAALIEL